MMTSRIPPPPPPGFPTRIRIFPVEGLYTIPIDDSLEPGKVLSLIHPDTISPIADESKQHK